MFRDLALITGFLTIVSAFALVILAGIALIIGSNSLLNAAAIARCFIILFGFTSFLFSFLGRRRRR